MPLSVSRAIIDLEAYASNIRALRKLLPQNARVIAVVKANAYGHGLEQIARRAIAENVQMLGVSNVEEGIQLRTAGIDAPIIVLMQPAADAMHAAIEHNLRVMISHTSAAERLGEIARKLNRVAPVHCKIDSGMGRQGFDIENAERSIMYLTRISNIDIEGIATHFPAAELREDPFTLNQIKTFRHLLKQLDKQGIPYEMVHAANSSAIVNYPASIFNLVRPGIITYGVPPVADMPPPVPLHPVLRWETRIALIRDMPAGAPIGYGRAYTTSSRAKLAILPVGYADGYKYALSNNADVLIKGRRCPVRGAVSMDQIVVDVTGVPTVQVDDMATLIGVDGSESISVLELAQKAKTIPYDILTGIGPRVLREYTP
jgi:alanine racemase